MIGFCELLARSFPPGGPTSALLRFVDADDFKVLQRLNVFVPSELDGRYPCPNRTLGEHCPRRIIQAPNPVAVCGNATAQCDEVPLTADDLRGSELSVAGFLLMLARALSIKGKPSSRSEGHGVFHLGYRDDGTPSRSYWFAASARFSSFRAFAQGLRTRAASRTAVIVIPTADAIDPGDRADVETAGIEVITLEGHLIREADGVRFEASGQGNRRIRVVGPPTRAGMSPAPFCIALTDRGESTLTLEEYQRTLERAGEFDLLIDAVGWSARGWVSRKRVTTEQKLTTHERDILMRLVRSGKPLSAKGFEPDPQSVDAAFKAFRRIRSKLDPGQQPDWKAFQSPRAGKQSKTAQFAPTRGLRWTVLLPHGDTESET